ncbi:YadA-like family protein, partial [Shewanella sp. 1CM18E]|uniref:YadA C-terminal domain-containing protein n=1 Tax=Shewanella sp. 1CM18E TaxID=2929169 RepID=UPI0020BE466E
KSKVKLTKELESLQTQIDNLGNEVGVPGSGIDEGLIAGLEKAKVEVQSELDFVTQLAIDTKNQANQTQLDFEIASDELAVKEDVLKASGIALNDHLTAQAKEVYELTSNVELMTNVTMQNANDISHGKVSLEIAATNMEVALTSQLKDLQAQIDRINSGDEGINPPSDGTGNDELIDGLEQAKIEVQAEIDDVNALVAENENSVANGKDSLELAVESMNSELQAAKQTMSKELVTAKSTLVTGADALMAQLQAMQARMDSQDALIAELQAGNNPSIPVEGNGIDQDLRDGLQTAGATMQAQLGKAAETLKTASNGLKNNKPDAGVSPIAPTEPSNPEFNPRDHEFGSVGQGAAKDWKTAKVDAGKAQMKDYLDTEFKSFEDDLMAKYNSEMNDFQNDVQEQMDSVMASSHAISNSRPFLTNGGTAVGVGTGFSGDASAVAIGVAHSFVDTGWSVSGSVNATTGSDSDVSFGAGVQYQF